MKAFLLFLIALGMVTSSFGQIYGARRYTTRIQPLVRPAPPNARQNPAPAAPAAPVQQPPPTVQPQYRAAVPAAAATVSRPADPAKAAAEKARNEEKQLEFFKRRAEEGSDHAQFELGMRYLNGKGVAPDEKLGREWLARAAKNGNTQASKKLAELGVDPEKIEVTPAPASVANTPKSTEAK